MRLFFTLVAILSLALALAPAGRAEEPSETEKILEQAEAIQAVVARIRGLEFKHAVKKGIQGKEKLRALVLEELAKDLPDEKLRGLEKSYAKIGFIPHGLDLKATLVDLYTEQIAGFYNPERKELFLIHASGPEQPIMAHELTHALQDQHFDLCKMHKAIEDDDDRLLALTSVIEGDATVVMVAYILKREAGIDIPVSSLPDIGKILSSKLGDVLGGGAGKEKLKTVPKVISKNLLFGYMQGASFCQKLIKRQGGFEAVSRAFRDPPQSSEQILHPEKYFDERRDDPIAVALPDLAATLGDGWKRLAKNVMGEFNTALLFKEKLRPGESERAAEGWGGDAWQCLEGPAGEIVFVWYMAWDREEDAGEFARTFERFHQARADGSELFLEKRGADVIVVDGGGETVRRKIAEALRAGTKKERRRGRRTSQHVATARRARSSRPPPRRRPRRRRQPRGRSARCARPMGGGRRSARRGASSTRDRRARGSSSSGCGRRRGRSRPRSSGRSPRSRRATARRRSR